MASTDPGDAGRRDSEDPTVGEPDPPQSRRDGRVTSAPPFAPRVAPENLSTERLLRGCRTIEVHGALRPALGGYALLARLGRGGMGVVYYGVNPRLGVDVAIKTLPWSLQDQDPGLVERFLREARLAAMLKSDHLVSVVDVDHDEATGNWFLVMEYVRNRTAGAWLHDATAAGRAGVDERDALDVCRAAARGLAAAHAAGIIHRDIKPDNLLIPCGEDGGLLLARTKLSDLGLARAEESAQSLTGTSVGMGTPGYSSPEQVRDAKRARKPADVYGLGATLYALLSGAPPYRGSTPMETLLLTLRDPPRPLRALRPDVSPGTAWLVDRCLERDPERRPQDADAFLDALARRDDAASAPRATASEDSPLAPQVIVTSGPAGVGGSSTPSVTPPSPGGDLAVGDVFSGCRIVELLGRDHIGTVYKATDEMLLRTVAVKVVHPTLLTNPDLVRQFIREAVTAAQINHPGFVAIHKVGRDERRALNYVVMEFVDGRLLEALVRELGPRPVEQVVPLAMQACGALAVAHDAGLFHRDIDPGTLIVDRRGVLKITLGLSGALPSGPLEGAVVDGPGARKVFGMPHYMAPERFEGKAADARADVYSLGATLYHALSGRTPHEGATTVQVIHSVLTLSAAPLVTPPDVRAVIEKMIARKPEDRYASMREVEDAFRPIAARLRA